MAEPGLGDRVYAEQVRQLYRLSRPGYLATLAVSSILIFALSAVVPMTPLGAWLTAMFLVTGARYLLYRAHLGANPPDSEAPVWARRFVIGAGVTGLLWGTAGSVLYPVASLPHQFLMIFLVGGVAVAALVVLAPVRQAFLAFVLPAIALLTATVLAQGTALHFYMGLAMVAFLAVLLGTMPVLSGMMRDALRAKFENTALVNQLSRANRELSERISHQERTERQARMEHAVTRILSESRSVEDAMPEILRAIAEAGGWVYGARWEIDKAANVLRCAETWCVDAPEVREFMAYSRQRTPKPGGTNGPIQQVWANNVAVWIPDVALESNVRRGPAALKAGLHSIFAFPILIGEEFYGVIEFYGREPRPPEPELMQAARNLGSQIGQFMARKNAEQNLRFVASHDPLTGLFNRSIFNERLQQALAQAARFERTLALLFIDLDGFKFVNDTFGHNAGDTMLAELATRLRATLREGDVIGRMGGDEFVVLVEEFTEATQVAEVAKKVLEAVTRPMVLQGRECHVTASLGISTYPEDGRDAQTLLKNADTAMYLVKQQGKNSFRFFSPQMNVHLMERQSMESSLRRAVERGELALLYQPRVGVQDGKVGAVEALLRWRHPTQGMISPSEFVPVAEDAGLIASIGEWVLHTACRQVNAWREQGLPWLHIAVNLSQRQFLQESLIPVVREALHRTGVDPARLEIEITEEMVMRNPERAERLLAQLKQLGARVVIDDFGIGLSSLNLLQRLPIDSVKIDRSLILDLPGTASAAALTRAVIAMAHSLGIAVTAEGVETREQWEFLRDAGCEEMQGNYFSTPVEADIVAGIARQPAAAGRRAGVQALRGRHGNGAESQ